MALSKKYLKSKALCKVTFEVPAPDATTVAVAGDFNDWDTSARLKKLKSGVFKGSFNLPLDSNYEFKYLIDGKWVNDASPDTLKWNEYAISENSVLIV